MGDQILTVMRSDHFLTAMREAVEEHTASRLFLFASKVMKAVGEGRTEAADALWTTFWTISFFEPTLSSQHP